MTKRLTDSQKAYNKFVQRRRRMEAKFRSNPKLLAAEIAKMIRADQHKGEDARDFDNGALHWLQSEWGQLKFTKDNAENIEVVKVEDYGGYRETTIVLECGTTACIAGHAAVLAGFPLVTAVDFDISMKHRTFEADKFIGNVYNVTDCWNRESKQRESIGEKAKELFGFKKVQQRWLFSGDRSEIQVLAALDEIAKHGTFNLEAMPYDSNESEVDRNYMIREYAGWED